MASKPKAGAPKKAPVKKMTQAEQSERFIETAREIGVDESGKEFELALERVLRGRSKKPSSAALSRGGTKS